MASRTVDLHFVSYAKDAEWFRWSIATVRKNLTGYRDIIVVCPVQDMDRFLAIVKGMPEVKLHPIKDWPRMGYHWQQWVKMTADQRSTADYILHIDSDVFISKPMDVSDSFVDGKPAWLWCWYGEAANAIVWQEPTARETGLVADREFMQGFPFILHRTSYSMARNVLQQRNAGQLNQQIERAARRGHNGYSEFNILGTLCWHYHHEQYHWVDRNREEWPKGSHCTRQFWSGSKVEDNLAAIHAMLDPSLPPGIRTTNRGYFIVDGDTHIGAWVEQHNRLDFDGWLLPRILAYVKPGDVVLDIGANIGDHTEGYAKATAGVDTGRVLAFEPNHLPFECLRRNMAGHGHVECHQLALGDAPGTASFVQSPNVGASHLVDGGEIPVITLDSLNLQRVDLIKIDAEGYETAIVYGASGTISRCKPVLALEVNKGALERAGTSWNELRQTLQSLGYSPTEVVGNDSDAQFDIICKP